MLEGMFLKGLRRYAGRYVSASLALMFGFMVSTIWLTPAEGQEFRASITGEILDTSGAVIPSATITVVNLDTQVRASTKSNSQGVYSLLDLLPGLYSLTAEGENFQSKVYGNLRLNSAQRLGLNITLQPGSVSQQIVVTAQTVDLDTVSATSGGVIDQTKVENMPSIGMMVWDDIAFTQGVQSASTNAFNLTPRNNANKYASSGAQTDSNIFYLNGAPMSDQGSWYFTPSSASVSQMQSSAMPYDVQYGRTGGGVFSSNLKAGTKDHHGSVYDAYGNKVLNTTPWVTKLSGLQKPNNIRNTWGAAVGGPIRKGKIFYFGSYETFHQVQPGTPQSTVPTTDMINGNFAGSGFTIYDPTSTYCSQKNPTGGCTTYSRNPFPNNVIPQSAISPIGQAILKMYPAPNKPGVTKNYVTTWPTTYEYTQYIGRLDQNFSENWRLYGIFTHEYNYSKAPGNGFTNEGWSGNSPTSTNYNVIVDLTGVISATKVLDLKASYGHTGTLTTTGDTIEKGFTADKLGFMMPVVGTTSHQNIVPTFTVTGGTNLFGNTANGTADADADFSGSMTQLLGRHSLHYGVEFMDIQTSPTGVLGNPNGTFTFNSVYTQQNPNKAVSGQGNQYASILLGYPASGSVSWNEPTFVTMHYYGAYLQDDFKVSSNLSVNLGLRWDVNTSPRDRHNRINSGFCLTCVNPLTSQINFAIAPTLQNPLLGGLQFAGVNGQPAAPFQVRWNDWQPRVGFSWNVQRDTVLRGGYGIYFPWASLAVNSTGFSQTTSYVSSLDGNLTPDNYFKSGNPYPNGAIKPSGSSQGLATYAGQAITNQNPNRGLRMTQHWSLGIQRRMPLRTLLDVEYMGTNVHHIPISTPIGVVSRSLQQQCNLDLSICNTNVANPFYGVLDPSTALGASSTINAWKLQRAYPLFNGVTQSAVPAGSSYYNGVVIRVERTVQNLNFVFNYYYSNWIDKLEYLNSGNFIDAKPVKELDPLDRRNALNLNMVYPLPSTHKHGVVGFLANDWVFASSLLWGTGTPLVLPTADFNWGAPGCSSYAPAGGQTRAHWFNNNMSCWTQLGTWEAQTTPNQIGYIRNPIYIAWNPGFSKQFPLPYREMRGQLRAQATNGANHPIWGAPSTSLATPPTYTPQTSWTGFGTLSNTPLPQERQLIVTLKISF